MEIMIIIGIFLYYYLLYRSYIFNIFKMAVSRRRNELWILKKNWHGVFEGGEFNEEVKSKKYWNGRRIIEIMNFHGCLTSFAFNIILITI